MKAHPHEQQHPDHEAQKKQESLCHEEEVAPVEPVGQVLTDCALAICGDRIHAIRAANLGLTA